MVFEGTPDESVYNPIGTVHGGYVCTLADTVAACAVHTTLEPGTIYTSIDLNVSYTRPVTRDSGTLRAVGTVVKPGRRVAFCRADIFDGAGKVVATATSSCLVMPGAAQARKYARSPAARPPGGGNPAAARRRGRTRSSGAAAAGARRRAAVPG